MPGDTQIDTCDHSNVLLPNATRAFPRNGDLQRHKNSVHARQANIPCPLPEGEQAQVSFARKDHLKQRRATRPPQIAIENSVPDLLKVEPRRVGVSVSPSRKRQRVSTGRIDGREEEQSSLEAAEAEIERLRTERRELQVTINKLVESNHTLIMKKS